MKNIGKQQCSESWIILDNDYFFTYLVPTYNIHTFI